MVLRRCILFFLTFFLIMGMACLPKAIYASAFDLSLMPPGESLKELQTEHFHIIFQESLEPVIPYLSKECEVAYTSLTSIFQWYPGEKIVLLFIDAFDTHNGWATAIPHNQICIYAAGAEPGSSIFQPGDYIRSTLYHELTHVLNMDRRQGYNLVCSKIFGKMLPVNYDPLSTLLFFMSTSPVTLAPTWYLEGVAIWAETEFSSLGRGRASLPDMIFRCAVQENNLLPYRNWELEIPYWPYEFGAYLYGMKIISHLSENTLIEEPVGDLVVNLSRVFMFNFNVHSQRVFGQKFKYLVQKMLIEETQRQEENLNILKQLPPISPQRLTKPEMIVSNPICLKNGIYFLAKEEDQRDSLAVFYPETGQVKSLSTSGVTARFGNLAASVDGRYLYYTSLNIQNNSRYYYEIRSFDTQTRQNKLITNQGRYRAFDLAPDGRHIAAVSMRNGESYLLQTTLTTAGDPNQEAILAKSTFQENFDTPRYAPDGQRLVCIKAGQGGYDLVVFDLATGAQQVIYHSRSQLLFPRWCPNKEAIAFVSDENGVFNLYQISPDGQSEPIPLTHVLGGIMAYDFDYDQKKIAAVAYDSRGFYLTLLPYQPEALAGQNLPKIIPPLQGKIKVRGQGQNENDQDPNRNPERLVLLQENEYSAIDLISRSSQAKTPLEKQHDYNLQPSRAYSSLGNLRLDYWSPWLTASAFEVEGGAGIVFSDPTGYQGLSLIGGIESKYETPLGSFLYTYRGWYPTISLFALQDQQVYPGLLESSDEESYDYVEEVSRGGLVIEMPWLKNDFQLSGQLGYQFLNRNFIQESGEAYQNKTIQTPNLSEDDEGSIWVQADFFNGTAFKRSCSFEDGRLLTLIHEQTHPVLGGKIFSSRSIGEWNEYLPLPWAKNHVFKLAGVYGAGSGDNMAQGLFGLGGLGSPILTPSFGVPRTISLRGYEENTLTGRRIAKVSCAYRWPILDFSRGMIGGSFPIYFKQLFAEVFYEGGRTWETEKMGASDQWIQSMGLEVNFSLKLLRFAQFAPGLGVLYAPERLPLNCEKGETGCQQDQRFQIYLTFKGIVNP